MMRSLCARPARRWAATSPSMRTTRSNCAELEPLNNDTIRAGGAPAAAAAAGGGTHHAAAGARRAFFVGDAANEIVVASGDVDDDAVPAADGIVQEDAV